MGRPDRDTGLRTVVLASLIIGLILCTGCFEQASRPTQLKVIAAGSLLAPFAEAEQEFEAAHPGVDVQIEGHGSIQVIRQVTDLHRRADVVAVADASLIPDLMYRPMEGTTANYTDSYIAFGGNDLVIAYTGKSRYAGEISPENWPDILSRPDVRVGFSNPMLDAAGYRTLMVVQLAEGEYGKPSLFDTMIAEQFTPPLPVTMEGPVAVITLPEIMRPSGDKLVIRDGSIYLLSLLEAGGIDYAFEYRSVSETMNLPYVELPASINLGEESYSDQYGKVKVILGFQRFSSIGQERTGMPIVYAITVPANAPNPGLAHEFMEYVVQESGKGRPGWPAPLPEGLTA